MMLAVEGKFNTVVSFASNYFFMGERRTYYSRRNLALIESWVYLSGITDGMQQNRCLLPWFGNNKPPPKHLKQHLQGVLLHDRNMRVYRSFSNVRITGNYCVHTWLIAQSRINILSNNDSK